ncbi:MAG: hypothetical protein LBD51_00670, partial [Bifidobacteriaceae bacterium]|nr:hypothetical protein [Bifidobacteriaceae bacterium]
MSTGYPTPDLARPEPASQTEALERQRRQFAEDLSLIWELAGTSRMDGRVLGYLMVTDQPCLSSAQLAQLLGVSAGAISMATRRLVD